MNLLPEDIHETGPISNGQSNANCGSSKRLPALLRPPGPTDPAERRRWRATAGPCSGDTDRGNVVGRLA